MLRAGQKVVCVNAGQLPSIPSSYLGWYANEAPVEGETYTIRKVFLDRDARAILWLEEITRSPEARSAWGDDVGYSALRFRPLTDISALTALLTSAPKEKERA